MNKYNPHAEEVSELLAIESLVGIENFSDEEITKLALAAEDGFLDWDWDRNDARTYFDSQDAASYSYFFATYEDLISKK
jgi:hypothetical protein